MAKRQYVSDGYICPTETCARHLRKYTPCKICGYDFYKKGEKVKGSVTPALERYRYIEKLFPDMEYEDILLAVLGKLTQEEFNEIYVSLKRGR